MIDRRPTNTILADPATPEWIKVRARVAEQSRRYRRACRRQQLRVALKLAFMLVLSVGLWWAIVAAINAWVAPFLWATPV